MSWTASAASVAPADLDEALISSFEKAWPKPAPGVREQFEAALRIKDEGLKALSETELVSCSLNGHVKQNETDWGSSLMVSVTAHG